MAKKSKYDIRTRSERIDLMCQHGCGTFVENLPSDTKAVTCWKCVVRMVEPPIVKVQKIIVPTEKRSRGWQFKKEYISPSGKVYHFGKEVMRDAKITSTGKVGGKQSKKLVVKEETSTDTKRDSNQSKNTPKRKVRRKK